MYLKYFAPVRRLKKYFLMALLATTTAVVSLLSSSCGTKKPKNNVASPSSTKSVNQGTAPSRLQRDENVTSDSARQPTQGHKDKTTNGEKNGHCSDHGCGEKEENVKKEPEQLQVEEFFGGDKANDFKKTVLPIESLESVLTQDGPPVLVLFEGDDVVPLCKDMSDDDCLRQIAKEKKLRVLKVKGNAPFGGKLHSLNALRSQAPEGEKPSKLFLFNKGQSLDFPFKELPVPPEQISSELKEKLSHLEFKDKTTFQSKPAGHGPKKTQAPNG